MSLLAGALALVPVWALGHVAGKAAGIRGPGLAGAVADFAAGVLALAVLGTAMVWAGRLSVVPVYAALAAAWWAYRRRGGPEPAAPLRRGARPAATGPVAVAPPARVDRGVGIGTWPAAAAALVVLALAATALTDRLEWDGWVIWALRAKILLVEAGLPDWTLRKPGPLDFAHPEYPLAVPLLDWWLFRHAGAPLPALASLAGAVWLACLVALLWSALRERAGAATAGLAALGLALFRPIGQYATGGYADVVMALALLGAVVELRSAAAGPGGAASWWRAAVYLSLGALAKNEGTAAALAAVAAVAGWSAWRRRMPAPRATAAAALLVPVALGAGWQLYARSLGLGVEQVGALPGPGALLERAALVGGELARLAVYRSWGPVVALVALGYVTGALRGRRWTGPAPWLPALYLAAALGVYLSTPQDLAWLLDASLARVVSHAVPAALFVALIGLPAPAGAAAPGGAPPRAGEPGPPAIPSKERQVQNVPRAPG